MEWSFTEWSYGMVRLTVNEQTRRVETKSRSRTRCRAWTVGAAAGWTSSFGCWLKFLQFRHRNIGLFIRAGQQRGAYVCADGRRCALWTNKAAQRCAIPCDAIEGIARPVHTRSTSIYPAGQNGPGSMRFIAPERVQAVGQRDYLSSGSWPW